MEQEKFCQCENRVIYTINEEWGYQEICNKCGLKIEDGFHYYNHYDGEDHDDSDV